jgi:hypothetical protein
MLNRLKELRGLAGSPPIIREFIDSLEFFLERDLFAIKKFRKQLNILKCIR